MRAIKVNGVRVTIVRSGVSNGDKLQAEILCIICNKPKFVDWYKLRRGECITHRECVKRMRIETFRNTEGGIRWMRTIVINYSFKKLSANARHRHIKISLPIEEFERLIFNNCFYCGTEPDQSYKYYREQVTDRYNIKFHGIDRVNNSIGYVLGNCVSCCDRCNRAKASYSMSEFLEWANRLALYQSRIKAVSNS